MKILSIVLALLALQANAQTGCPIDSSNQPINPSCPYVRLQQYTYQIRNDGGEMEFNLNKNVTWDILVSNDDAINSGSYNGAPIGTPYIPLFEDCNLPTSTNDPGLCDVEGTFSPYKIWAHNGINNQNSYIKRELSPLGVIYHYSSEHVPSSIDRDTIKFHKIGYEFKNSNEYHLVLDYTHYRLDQPPVNITLDKNELSPQQPGEIQIEFDGSVLNGCNTPSISYPSDPNQTVAYIKTAPDEWSHLFPAVSSFRIRQWRNQVYYEINTKSALYGDPGLVICRDYLTDDIYEGGFEDGIFAHGFDDRPYPFYPPAKHTGQVPPRP